MTISSKPLSQRKVRPVNWDKLVAAKQDFVKKFAPSGSVEDIEALNTFIGQTALWHSIVGYHIVDALTLLAPLGGRVNYNPTRWDALNFIRIILDQDMAYSFNDPDLRENYLRMLHLPISQLPKSPGKPKQKSRQRHYSSPSVKPQHARL